MTKNFIPVITSRWVHLQTAVIDTEPAVRQARLTGDRRAKIAHDVWDAVGRAGTSAVPLIVQCAGPLQENWRATLAVCAGVTINRMDYLPDNALCMPIAPEKINAVADLDFVRWIDWFRPEYKISPALRLPARGGESLAVTLATFRSSDVKEVCALVKLHGGTVKDVGVGKRRGVARAVVPKAAVEKLAQADSVAWIEPTVRPVWFNNVAVGAPLMNVLPVRTNFALAGAGQIVCVCDTGLDTGDAETIHPDFTNRIVAGFSWGRTNDWSDTMGHGTHCAGSVLGDGSAYSNGLFAGAAPETKLIVQSIADEANNIYLPPEMGDLFRQSYAAGARIQSDSWGGSEAGAYTILSRQADEFVWDYPDMLLIFAAGNDGVDADMDGVVDEGSIGTPASAKNVLAVGAAATLRPAGSGGCTAYRWGEAFTAKYPVAPIRDGLVSTPWDGMHQGMAAFSSRGPCQDGRIKPDIVAPGTDIISTRSRMPGASALWGTGEGVLANAASNYYTFSGGTSMSTPLTAGAMALVRQYFTDYRGWTNPSAALLKAMIAAGARSLSPGQYGVDESVREVPPSRPNNVEGWGHVNLADTLFPVGGTNLFADDRALATGNTDVFEFVADGSNRLSIVLAWSDYPSLEAAAINLVNDLDLLVVAPDGQVRHANGQNEFDRINNMESIDIVPALPGTYTIHVLAYNVPQGPQPYALVIHTAPLGDVLEIAGVWHTPPLISNGMPIEVHAQIACGRAALQAVRCIYRVDRGAWRSWPMEPAQAEQGIQSDYAVLLPPQNLGSVVEYYVEATDVNGHAAVSATNTLTIQSPVLYVSPRGGQLSPYDSLATAFTNLQAAVDYAVPGTVILVDSGRYETATLHIDKPITIQSIAGPEHTILSSAGNGACVSNTALAVLEGFTITGGAAELGGGAFLRAGILRNCWISSNVASGSGGGVFNCMGTLASCRITANAAENGGGIFQNVGGTVENCVITGNTANSMAGGIGLSGFGGNGGEVRSCLIAGNHASSGGGAALLLGGRMINTTISGNSATTNGGGVAILFYGEIVNSIIYGNTPNNCDGEGLPQRPARLINCCVYPAITNNNVLFIGGMVADPLFQNASAGNFHLLVNSPCRDAGTNLDWMADALDLDGRARIINAVVDIGAYELCLPREAFNMAARRHGACDFDGDGRMDPAVYSANAALWRAWISSEDYRAVQALFGGADCAAVSQDYDGDGKTDLALHQPRSGAWQLAGFAAAFCFGGEEWQPAASDFDGDGCAAPAVWRQDGTWAARLSSFGYALATLTMPLPAGDGALNAAAADYDGDSKMEPAFYRAEDGLWAIALSSMDYRCFYGYFGSPQHLPAPADYDGDGSADPAVYEPQTGLWVVLLSHSRYQTCRINLAQTGGLPVPGDYDGDGVEDPAVYTPATRIWTAWLSSAGYRQAQIAIAYVGSDQRPVCAGY